MQSLQASSLIRQILKHVGYATIKNQSQNLLQISLVLNERSTTQLLLQMTIPKFGKCQQQSILTPMDCHMQPPWQIKMHTCARQAHKVSHLSAFPSLLSILIWVQDWLVGFTLIGRQLPTCSTHSILFGVDLPRLKSQIAKSGVLTSKNYDKSECSLALGKPTKFLICPSSLLYYPFLSEFRID